MQASSVIFFARNWMGRKRFAMAMDLGVGAVAQFLLFAGLLRYHRSMVTTELVAISFVMSGFALYAMEAHRQMWSRVSLNDVLTLVAAAGIVSPVLATYAYFRINDMAVSRVFIGSMMTLVCAWSAPRMLLRLYIERRQERGDDAGEVEKVVLYGSGRHAERFIKSNAERHRHDIVGFLHDDPIWRGRRVRGVPALGGLDDFDAIYDDLRDHGRRPVRLIVAGDGERPDELAAALEAAARHGLRLARLPGALRLVDAGRGGDGVRDVSIEDILHRDMISLNDGRVAPALSNAVVMITGAGGSIGSELVRQVAALEPARIVLVEFSEYNLYRIDHELEQRFPHVPRALALCDVRDARSLRAVFARERPRIVLHAAALKHVPLLESQPDQAILTNVMGTRTAAMLAREYGAEVFTLVSTDKAVNPGNVMGCTKRWAEIICQSLDAQRGGAGGTRFACVRFGNVLDSAGSVVPLFRQQIAEGGPITVTHADITRYFMTIPEACELILTATAATGGASGAASTVFVLDMGAPVKIMDLAERMIQLHGLRPGVDIQIVVTGLRPGEKLYEELAHDDEALAPAPIAKARLARARTVSADVLQAAFDRLIRAVEAGDPARMIEELRCLVPEFAPGAASLGAPPPAETALAAAE